MAPGVWQPGRRLRHQGRALEAVLELGDTVGFGLARRDDCGGTEWIARETELARLAREVLAR